MVVPSSIPPNTQSPQLPHHSHHLLYFLPLDLTEVLGAAAVEVVLAVAPDLDFVGGVEAVELGVDITEALGQLEDVGILGWGMLEVVVGWEGMMSIGRDRLEMGWTGRRDKGVSGREKGG